MGFTDDQNKMLQADLDKKHVVKPSGKFGPKGDYIYGWHAIAEANRIFGHDGWSSRIKTIHQTNDPVKNDKGNLEVSYMCVVQVTVKGVVRQDVGYGSGAAKKLGDAHEGAFKEAATDALKRVLRTFGNPFGLALYDKTQANVSDVAGNEKAWNEFAIKLNTCALQEHIDELKMDYRKIVKDNSWSQEKITLMVAEFARREKELSSGNPVDTPSGAVDNQGKAPLEKPASSDGETIMAKFEADLKLCNDADAIDVLKAKLCVDHMLSDTEMDMATDAIMQRKRELSNG